MSVLKILATAALAILVAPLAVEAQPAAKVWRIGFLSPGFPPPPFALLQGLRELGYVEGQNTAVEARWAEGHVDRLTELAADLVRLKVDVIFANGYLAILAAKTATKTIPIVFSTHVDPTGTGLVASLARPGANLTGSTLMSPELAGKRLELLRELVPGVSRVAVLMYTANPGFVPTMKQTEAAARSLGVRLHLVEANTPGEFERAFSAMGEGGATALHVQLELMFLAQRARIVELAARTRLPAMYDVREFVDAGGLISYGPRLSEELRRLATHVHKILRGMNPANLPVEQPTRFELVINLKTAKALGLTIPRSVLIRADEVIE
ncbi:MAG TPA: ABC transporter substrate-binding protein [Thermoleophilia bacterium]|nr:ABC transporter substrate-binding protein [Thermoleophilia bacterium]